MTTPITSVRLTESGQPVDKAKDVQFLRMKNGTAVLSVDSGNFRFASEID